MSNFSYPALGKCGRCGDQLWDIPPFVEGGARRSVCVVCTANELEDLKSKQPYVPTPEEAERMAQ